MDKNIAGQTDKYIIKVCQTKGQENEKNNQTAMNADTFSYKQCSRS